MKKAPFQTPRAVLLSLALGSALAATAGNTDVKHFRYAGPYAVATPCLMDSVDIKGQAFAATTLLDSPLALDKAASGKSITATATAPGSGHDALHLLAFTVSNTVRTKATIRVDGLRHYRLYVDGQQVTPQGARSEVTLTPSVHTAVIKYLTDAGHTDSLKVSVETPDGRELTVGEPTADTRRAYNIYDVVCAPVYSRVALSADGKYVIVRKTWKDRDGRSHAKNLVVNYATGQEMSQWDEQITWMPKSPKFYFERKGSDGRRELIAVDPATQAQQVLATGLPEGWMQMAPDEKTLVYTLTTDGRQKDPQVYDVKSPDDRQPGWRTRTNLARYDLATGVLQPITYGYHNISLNDISADSRYILVSKSEERLTRRPTTVTSFYRIDLQTLQADTVVEKGEFLSYALFAPDGKSILFGGSPEAFDGIGKNVDPGQIPSMTDNQLFLLTLADKKVKALTRDFDPSVSRAAWSRADGNIYLQAEDKDCVHLFQLNPKTGATRLISTPEELIEGFSLASGTAEMAFYGQGASNADRLYRMSTKTLKPVLIDDLSARVLKDIELGECKAWTYRNERGDTLTCRYYLPPHFDAAKKYPMVVNYYGGCSPTSRNFQSRYPQHVYAAMGYVVLVVNPSGATGFGQKFSARHVDTAGEGVAEDIIGSTRQFCREHAFVDDKKIGCIGASYGGFMTQYLQTKTDLFAAAISHAGISDHTSYWGEGYWGYSYSEVSMAGEYPWTNRHLYVDQSPLYNADKIHTPLLFVHGTADNNVPVGESIQLYTALKLLGRPTAMVLVEGQDHHILDYEKRLKWQDTIFAWFAKWLQDDPTWWDEMYGKEQM